MQVSLFAGRTFWTSATQLFGGVLTLDHRLAKSVGGRVSEPVQQSQAARFLRQGHETLGFAEVAANASPVAFVVRRFLALLVEPDQSVQA